MRMASSWKHVIFAAGIAAGVSVPNAASGATLYWDTNGAVAGTGTGAANNGTWGVDSFWTTNALGTGAANTFRVDTTIASADALNFSAGTNGTGNFTVAVNGTVGAVSIQFQEGNALIQGGTAIDLAATATISSILPSNGNGAGVINTAITGAGTQLTINTQSGDITLGGANNYAGLTIISTHATAGTPGAAVHLSGTNIGGGSTRISNIATLVLENATSGANGGLATGTLQLGSTSSSTAAAGSNLRNGTNSTINVSSLITFPTQNTAYVTFQGTHGIRFTNTGTINLTGTGISTRYFDVSDALMTVTIDGVMDDGDFNSGIVKFGEGRLVLTADNTYSGSTIVNAGTLQVDGAVDSTAAVVSIRGGVLAGTGTIRALTDIGGTTGVTGGTLAAGNNGVGTLTFDADSQYNTQTQTGAHTVSFTTTGKAVFQVNGWGAGLFDVAQGGADAGVESILFDGDLTLAFAPGFNTTGSAKIFDFDSYHGSFATVQSTGLAAGYEATFDPLTGEVSVTLIPEPGTMVLAGLGLAVLGCRRRSLRA